MSEIASGSGCNRLMGTTFRYIFLEEERCQLTNTYTMLKPIVQTVRIRVQFFRRKWRLEVGANDIALM